MENSRQKLIKLFQSTFYLSAFTFGGGYVIISLLKTKFVNELHWIEEDEMLDLVAIAQSAPGPIAVNGAIVVGYKIAGIPGVLVSVLGAVLPPLIVITLISMCYSAFAANRFVAALLRGMTAGVGAVIVSVVYDMGKSVAEERSILSIGMMIAAFLASTIWNVNVVLLIVIAACIGCVRFLWKQHREKGGPVA